MTAPHLPRRALVGAAVWTAPAVLVVSAAPAMAASTTPTPTLVLSLGTSSIVPTTSLGAPYYDLRFANVTVTSGAAIDPGTLTMLVRFRPNVAHPDPRQNLMYRNSTPAGWTATPPGAGSALSVTWVYTGQVTAGGSVAIANGDHVGTNLTSTGPYGEGFFDITVSAPGHAPVTVSLATPGQLKISLGSSSVVPFGEGFYDLRFADFAIISGVAIEPGNLTMLLQFRPAAPHPDPSLPPLYRNSTPAGWTATPPGIGPAASVTWTYSGAVTANGSASVGNGDHAGTNLPNSAPSGQGFFDLTVSAPGAASVTVSLETPGRTQTQLRRSTPSPDPSTAATVPVTRG